MDWSNLRGFFHRTQPASFVDLWLGAVKWTMSQRWAFSSARINFSVGVKRGRSLVDPLLPAYLQNKVIDIIR